MPLSLLNHSALALFAQRTRIPTSARSIGFELELIQTQMTQKPMLRAEVYARALRASQNRKEASVPFGFVLVRVRVRSTCGVHHTINPQFTV